MILPTNSGVNELLIISIILKSSGIPTLTPNIHCPIKYWPTIMKGIVIGFDIQTIDIDMGKFPLKNMQSGVAKNI